MQTWTGSHPKSSPWCWGIWAPAPLLPAPTSSCDGAFLQWPHFHTCQSLQNQWQVTRESHTLPDHPTLHTMCVHGRPPLVDRCTQATTHQAVAWDREGTNWTEVGSTKNKKQTQNYPPSHTHTHTAPLTHTHPSKVSLTYLSCISPQGALRYTRELHRPWHTRSSLCNANTLKEGSEWSDTSLANAHAPYSWLNRRARICAAIFL